MVLTTREFVLLLDKRQNSSLVLFLNLSRNSNQPLSFGVRLNFAFVSSSLAKSILIAGTIFVASSGVKALIRKNKAKGALVPEHGWKC